MIFKELYCQNYSDLKYTTETPDMKPTKPEKVKVSFGVFGSIKITQKLIGLLIGLLIGFVIIGLAYMQVLKAESIAAEITERMTLFEKGIHEVQLDLLNARRSETEFYLKKYPIYLGKFDTRIIVASQNLKNLTTLVKTEKKLDIVTELGEAFENYREKFLHAAELQIDIGLDENTGLNLDLRNVSLALQETVRKMSVPQLDIELNKILKYENDFIRSEDGTYSNALISEISIFKEFVSKSNLSDKKKQRIHDSIVSYHNVFLKMSNAVLQMSSQKSDVKKSVKIIEPLFDKMITISNKVILESRNDASYMRDKITTIFISTLVIIALAVSIGFFFLARSIIKPMKVLQDTVLRVNEGDLKARAGLNRGDELGELSNAFDKLLDERLSSLAQAEKDSEKLNNSVISLIKAVSQLAQNKDLTVKIPVSEDITGAISDSLNLLAKETSKIMRLAQSTSSQVSDVSLLIKQQSDSVIFVANKERKEVENTAIMLEETVATMNEISDDANEANTKAEITIQNTQRALQTVLSSVEGINSIRSTISETEKRIKRLGERSQEISGIVSLINSIAERTHILALNASMHAASAGEAGRGFAVVADEVQRLAENAREATSEISTVVNNIRIETADTVTIMNTVISQVAEGTDLINQASQNMKRTQQATNDLVSSVQHIAKSSEEQAGISNELLERAKVIKESTELTGRKLLEQTKSTEKLVRYSDQLVSIVGVFTLSNNVKTEKLDAFSTQEIQQAV